MQRSRRPEITPRLGQFLGGLVHRHGRIRVTCGQGFPFGQLGGFYLERLCEASDLDAVWSARRTWDTGILSFPKTSP